MAIKYYVRETTNPMDSKKPKLYMAQSLTDGVASQQTIIDRIVEKSSLAEGDVLSCVTEVFKELTAELLEGHSVKLENFGSFHLTLKSRTQDSPEKVTADCIEGVYLRFRPAQRWYDSIKPKTRFTRVAAPVKVEKPGGGSASNGGGSDSGGDSRGDGDGMEM